MPCNKSFQEIIFLLQQFWSDNGCAILQPYDTEVGAGTSHHATTLRVLGNESWNVAFVQPCRRPKDGRYAENPNRTQYYFQFQVVLKPNPDDPQTLYLKSLEQLGIDIHQHEIRFVEDDWENPSLGAAGLGWEVWCDGMEITQFTYFQQVGGIACSVVPVEITYGLERITTFLQGVNSHFDINWNGQVGNKKLTYGDILKRFEKEFSYYNFDIASVDVLFSHFNDYEQECNKLLAHQLVMPAYEQCVKANHCFNLLDARGVISVTERAGYIGRVRALAKNCCQAWVQSIDTKEENHE